ncbi:MAG: monomethylamine:corrinoid methyltransferase [Candidatus Auribacterota bacterium]|nr:monomethylamine:corrinoid methyltransferase [Candidatus Auribacterota bacterium]
MATLEQLVEMLQRSKDGPPCTPHEWDMEVIPRTVNRYLEKFGLKGAYKSEEPVNLDPDLADRFFEAGLAMAVEIGLFCPDTETIIKVSREEILRAVADAPSKLALGEGDDRITLTTRKPEDTVPPIFGGPLALAVPQDLYVPIVAGILACRKVRILQGPSLDTIFGRAIYSGTPFESIAAFQENRLRKEAVKLADRPGIPSTSISSSTTAYGQMAGFPGQTSTSNPSLAMILNPAELKVTYDSFHKAAAAVGYNAYHFSGSPTIIGGYSGPAEGATLSAIATDLLQMPILGPQIPNTTVYDVRFNSTTGRHGLWAMSVATQALARNTDLIVYKVVMQTAGPCTEEILYANAAGLLSLAASGASMTIGCWSAGGTLKDYITPLEHRFCAEVFEAGGGLSLEAANELTLYALSKYEDDMRNQPLGKSIYECYDVNSMQPTKEWREIYDRVTADFAGRGVNFVEEI